MADTTVADPSVGVWELLVLDTAAFHRQTSTITGPPFRKPASRRHRPPPPARSTPIPRGLVARVLPQGRRTRTTSGLTQWR